MPRKKRVSKIEALKDVINSKAYKATASELQISRAFYDYVCKAHPGLSHLLMHIPNEGDRGRVGGSIQQMMGLKAGVFDYFFAKPVIYQDEKGQHIMCGLWIELKKAKGRLSKAQQRFQQDMLSQHYSCVVARGIDEAIKDFEDYLSSDIM